VRHLLVKDLQILRRSPGLLGLLVLYAVVLGVPVGYGLSAPPSKPRVAFLNEVSPTDTTVLVGAERLDVTQYADDLFAAIEPVEVGSRREAEEAVRSGEALAALIVPADVTRKLQDAVALTGSGEVPTLEVLYAAENPLKRRYVEQTIDARLAEANRALSRRITQVAARYIDILLRGGDFDILGRRVEALGLQRSARILAGVERTLPAADPRRAELARVRRFAELAIDNLDLSDEVLGAIGSPIKVRARTVAGSASSSLDSFAIAAAATIALMVVAVLLGAGMLALEREEHAFGRLVRGQSTGGTWLYAGASDNPETLWFHELVLLHAAASYAVQAEDRTVAAAVARNTEFHLRETQPDHATAQPWGLFAFAWNRDTRPLADELLHAVQARQTPAPAAGVPSILLADALYCLELFG